MKKRITGIALMGLILVLLTGTFLLVLLKVTAQQEEQEEKNVDITMFSAYTDCEVFQDIPAMITQQGKIYDAEDYGDENYLINVSGTTTEDYEAYLKTLESAGFKKHSDNGEDAMEGYALTTAYTKDNITLSVAQAIKQNHTYISASYDLPLSEHLIYKDEYMDGVTAGAKTSVHMIELWATGNSFVIQLKNGHFLIHDGGQDEDAPYLLDYLEELTPGDEKPVVEAWFLSHAHSDHTGAMIEIAKEMKEAGRIYVEGFYYTEASDEVFSLLTMQPGEQNNMLTKSAILAYRTQTGEIPEIYRLQFGQRYYFCDVMIDVPLTIEQYSIESYHSNDFNDTSTWLMHHIENQRFLISGDTNHTGMLTAMDMFEESYFDLDIFATFHHGINVYEYFIDYCTYKTVLYTSFRTASIWEPSRSDLARVADNEYLRTHCEEYLAQGGGTVILTFPYSVGEYKKAAPCDWRYNGYKGCPNQAAE